VADANSDTSELQLIQEERRSTEKCLEICAKLSDHINQIRLTSKRSGPHPESANSDSLPERITHDGLQECKNSLLHTTAKLERHMREVLDLLLTKSKKVMTSEEEYADLERLRDEWETARRCMDICSRAGNHLKESVTTIENYATGDAIQFMVSTDGKTIHGKNQGLGWRSRQVGGHLSDASVQQLSRDMTNVNFRNTKIGDPPSRDNSQSPEDKVNSEPASDFSSRYGRGFELTPKSSSDMPMSSTAAVEGGRSNPPRDQGV
jgi:hypothetical protein